MLAEANASIHSPPARIQEIRNSLFLRKTSPHLHRRISIEYCPQSLPRRKHLTDPQYTWLYGRASSEDGVLRSEWSGKPIEHLSVHHIYSVLWMVCRFDPLGLIGPELYNDPFNLIVLSRNEHALLHPESRRLDHLVKTNMAQFLLEVHQLKLRVLNGGKNWEDQWDREFLTTTNYLTLRHIEEGNPWPERGVQLIQPDRF